MLAGEWGGRRVIEFWVEECVRGLISANAASGQQSDQPNFQPIERERSSIHDQRGSIDLDHVLDAKPRGEVLFRHANPTSHYRIGVNIRPDGEPATNLITFVGEKCSHQPRPGQTLNAAL